MKLYTKNCKKFNHLEFELTAEIDKAYESAFLKFAAGIEKMVYDGSVFKEGETFQVGWVVTKVTTSDGRLSISEPDMKSFPIEFVPGITNTISHQMHQNYVADSLEIPRDQIQHPSILNTAIVCEKFLNAESKLLYRDQNHGQDSGWFFGCTDSSHDHKDPSTLFRMSLFEANVHVPWLYLWVALPQETKVVGNMRDSIEVYLHDIQLKILPHSFLDQAIGSF